MTSIRGTGSSPVLPANAEALAQPQATQVRSKAQATHVDTTERVAADAAAAFFHSSSIAPPAPPRVSFLAEAQSGAQSFAGQLLEMGDRSPATSEQMLLAFLKLQVLEASRGSASEQLANIARSTLYGVAIGEQKGVAQRNAQAQALANQAQQYEAQAESIKARGDEIVRRAGVDPAEIERLYDQSVAEGKNGDDVYQRYEALHQNDPDLTEKLAALRAAEPYYQQASMAMDEAEELGDQANNIGGWGIMGLYATVSQRAGTAGMRAMLAADQAQKELANELMALLAGLRPDAKAREEGVRELDRSRLEVAKLILDHIDSHALMSSGKSSMRS